AIGVTDSRIPYRQVTVINKGTISGDIDLEAQETKLVLRDGSSTSGEITLGDGDSTLVLWGKASLGETVIDGEGGHNQLVVKASDDQHYKLSEIIASDNVRNF